jgi:hypothetical protein
VLQNTTHSIRIKICPDFIAQPREAEPNKRTLMSVRIFEVLFTGRQDNITRFLREAAENTITAEAVLLPMPRSKDDIGAFENFRT